MLISLRFFFKIIIWIKSIKVYFITLLILFSFFSFLRYFSFHYIKLEDIFFSPIDQVILLSPIEEWKIFSSHNKQLQIEYIKHQFNRIIPFFSSPNKIHKKMFFLLEPTILKKLLFIIFFYELIKTVNCIIQKPPFYQWFD